MVGKVRKGKKKDMPSRKPSRKQSRKPKSARALKGRGECEMPCSNGKCATAKLARTLVGSQRTLNVRLSGSGERLHFKGFQNKSEVEDYLRDKFPRFHFTFVKNKDAQFIVIPNEAVNASDSALGESRARVYTLHAFERLLQHV